MKEMLDQCQYLCGAMNWLPLLALASGFIFQQNKYIVIMLRHQIYFSHRYSRNEHSATLSCAIYYNKNQGNFFQYAVDPRHSRSFWWSSVTLTQLLEASAIANLMPCMMKTINKINKNVYHSMLDFLMAFTLKVKRRTPVKSRKLTWNKRFYPICTTQDGGVTR